MHDNARSGHRVSGDGGRTATVSRQPAWTPNQMLPSSLRASDEGNSACKCDTSSRCPIHDPR